VELGRRALRKIPMFSTGKSARGAGCKKNVSE
jgi:hypothetical protein